MKVDVEQEGDSDDELEDAYVGSGPSIGSDLQPAAGSSVGEWFVDRAKYIPVRLTIGERKYLRLLEAALTVSEYTDKIDIIGFGLSKTKRIVHQIRELCAIMSGLLLSADYKMGQDLFTDKDFQANEEFYQTVFELGRRHKIMNPDKMRTTYGKLIYLLQVSNESVIGKVFHSLIGNHAGQPESCSQGHAQLLMRKAHQNCILSARRARCSGHASRRPDFRGDQRDILRRETKTRSPARYSK